MRETDRSVGIYIVGSGEWGRRRRGDSYSRSSARSLRSPSLPNSVAVNVSKPL